MNGEWGDTNIQSITYANMMPQWGRETGKRGEDFNSKVPEEARTNRIQPKNGRNDLYKSRQFIHGNIREGRTYWHRCRETGVGR